MFLKSSLNYINEFCFIFKENNGDIKNNIEKLKSM